MADGRQTAAYRSVTRLRSASSQPLTSFVLHRDAAAFASSVEVVSGKRIRLATKRKMQMQMHLLTGGRPPCSVDVVDLVVAYALLPSRRTSDVVSYLRGVALAVHRVGLSSLIGDQTKLDEVLLVRVGNLAHFASTQLGGMDLLHVGLELVVERIRIDLLPPHLRARVGRDQMAHETRALPSRIETIFCAVRVANRRNVLWRCALRARRR